MITKERLIYLINNLDYELIFKYHDQGYSTEYFGMSFLEIMVDILENNQLKNKDIEEI